MYDVLQIYDQISNNLVPFMKDGGSIILNSSIAGVKGFPGTTVYSASKQQFVLSPELGLPSSKEGSGSMLSVPVR
ncbi:MAG: SDR family NAD(P)-dependent oxidoreductase [Candidatus Nitrosopolaris sp.]